MKKLKFISSLLIMLIIIGGLPFSQAFANDSAQPNEIIEQLEGYNEYFLSGNYEQDGMVFLVFPFENEAHLADLTEDCAKTVKELTVPEKVLGCPVKEVGYISAEKLTKITLPKTVISISAGAFKECRKLSGVTVNGQLEHVGCDAFKYTAFLKNDENWKNDGLYLGKCLVKCRKNKGSFKIKKGTVTVAEKAFGNSYEDEYKKHSSVSSVELPDSVKYINDSAFEGCRDLKTIKIGKNVKEIGTNAFFHTAYSDNKKNWQKSLLYIDKYLVASKKQKSYKIKNGTKLIASSVFKGNKKLESITLSDSIKYINGYAFSGCIKLKVIKLPKKLVNLADYSLPDNENSKLKKITIDKSNKKYLTDKGVLFNKEKSELLCYPKGNKRASYTLPDTVNTIDCRVFSAHLQELKLKEGLNYLLYPFRLQNVKTLLIPKSVKYISPAYEEANLKTIYAYGNTYAAQVYGDNNKVDFVELCQGEHSFETVEETPATHFKKGCAAHKKCRNCGYITGKTKTEKLAVEAPKIKTDKNKLSASWEKVKGAAGYELQYTFKGKSKTIKTKKSKYSADNLKKGAYKIRVRAYQTENDKKVYSDWSKTKTVKVK